ncbi:MAG: hypothetical protein HOQ03_04170 [Thermoleophilia bacterium]|nr:hypothetical protein [Thermoleophilia bacterium]HWJ45151.1 hypothetical protein [Gaiellaceae bacterium]
MSHAVGDPTAERVARNDAAFRQSNEQLGAFSAELGFEPDELTPYLCECADLTCTTVVQVTRAEYESVRTSPIQFLTARGHEGTGEDWARVVEVFERYTIVEKVGDAAEVAAALDERAGR